MTWNAARAASRRPLHTKKVFKPVGDPDFNLKAGDDRTCPNGCGYSVCDCNYVVPQRVGNGMTFSYGVTNQGLPIEYHTDIPHGHAGWVEGYPAVLCGLLKRGDLEKVRTFVQGSLVIPGEARMIVP